MMVELLRQFQGLCVISGLTAHAYRRLNIKIELLLHELVQFLLGFQLHCREPCTTSNSDERTLM